MSPRLGGAVVWWMLALSCKPGSSEKSVIDDTSGTSGDTGDGSDTDDGGQEIVYPSGDRILIYYGHNGATGNTYGEGAFTTVEGRWKDSFGWNVDIRDWFADDLSQYRAIFFPSPGMQGTATWEQGDIANLNNAVAAGTRIVVLGDHDTCDEGDGTVGQLLAALGSTLRWNGNSDTNQIVYSDWVSGTHQPTTGVTSLRFPDPCYVDPGSGETIVASQSDFPLVGWERIGHGGDVVLVGDFEFMDDSGGLEDVDNQVFADNLVVVEP